MSIGVPAVVTDYGGNPGVIKNGENGYLVPIKSPRDTADSIVRILTNDDLRKYMHRRSMEMYEEKFTSKKYTENIERIYKEMEAEPKIKRINVLDAIIILIVLVACIVGYTYINKKEMTIAPKNTEKITYQIRTMDSLPASYDMIEENTVIYDSVKNNPIGTIIKKEILPAEKYEVDMNKGVYVKSDLPAENYVDILLTIEADAVVGEQDISVGSYVVKVGEQAYVKGKGYAGIGFVVKIER